MIKIKTSDTWSGDHSNFNNAELEESFGSLTVSCCLHCSAETNIKIYASYMNDAINTILLEGFYIQKI